MFLNRIANGASMTNSTDIVANSITIIGQDGTMVDVLGSLNSSLGATSNAYTKANVDANIATALNTAAAFTTTSISALVNSAPVSYTHLTLPTIYSV